MIDDVKISTITILSTRDEEQVRMGEIRALGSRELGIMMVISFDIFELSIFDLLETNVARNALLTIEQTARQQRIPEVMIPMMPPMAWLGADLMGLGYTLNAVPNPFVTGMKAPGWFQKRLG